MPFLQNKSVHLAFSSHRNANCNCPPRIGGHHFLLCQHTNTEDIAGQSAKWTLDSRNFLSWRRMAGYGIWGESSNKDRWWFIVWHNVYHPWVSKAQVMTEKHHKLSRTWKHSNSSVLVVKKITQEWSKLLHFNETDHKDANTTIEKTEIHSENEENIGVEPVAEPNKLKMMLWTNTKDGKWEIHVIFQAVWAVIKSVEDSLVTFVTKIMNKNLFSLA